MNAINAFLSGMSGTPLNQRWAQDGAAHDAGFNTLMASRNGPVENQQLYAPLRSGQPVDFAGRQAGRMQHWARLMQDAGAPAPGTGTGNGNGSGNQTPTAPPAPTANAAGPGFSNQQAGYQFYQDATGATGTRIRNQWLQPDGTWTDRLPAGHSDYAMFGGVPMNDLFVQTVGPYGTRIVSPYPLEGTPAQGENGGGALPPLSYTGDPNRDATIDRYKRWLELTGHTHGQQFFNTASRDLNSFGQ